MLNFYVNNSHVSYRFSEYIFIIFRVNHRFRIIFRRFLRISSFSSFSFVKSLFYDPPPPQEFAYFLRISSVSSFSFVKSLFYDPPLWQEFAYFLRISSFSSFSFVKSLFMIHRRRRNSRISCGSPRFPRFHL